MNEQQFQRTQQKSKYKLKADCVPFSHTNALDYVA